MLSGKPTFTLRVTTYADTKRALNISRDKDAGDKVLLWLSRNVAGCLAPSVCTGTGFTASVRAWAPGQTLSAENTSPTAGNMLQKQGGMDVCHA